VYFLRIISSRNTSYFERIGRALDQNTATCPDLTQEGSEVDYFLSILTEEILEIIQEIRKRCECRYGIKKFEPGQNIYQL